MPDPGAPLLLLCLWVLVVVRDGHEQQPTAIKNGFSRGYWGEVLRGAKTFANQLICHQNVFRWRDLVRHGATGFLV